MPYARTRQRLNRERAYAAAAEVQLMADIEECDSFFFLLEDYETFQVHYDVLSKADGTVPEDGDLTGLAFQWSSCALLNRAELGTYTDTVLGEKISGSNRDLLEKLYLARRGFETDRSVENVEGCEALWYTLTEAVVP